MKITIIADSDPRKNAIGGVATYTRYLITYLPKKYDIHVIGKYTPGDIVHTYPNASFSIIGDKPLSNIQFLTKLFSQKFESDIIHAQRPDWLLPFMFHPAKKIVTMHGMHAKNIRLKKNALLYHTYNMIETITLKRTDAIIAVAHITQDDILKKHRWLENRIHVIPVGINFDALSQLRRKQHEYVLYVGRLEKEKNVQRIIEACKANNYQLYIVGDGREDHDLRNFVMAKNASAKFFGQLNHDEIGEIMAKAKVLVLASDHEGLPTVALEAMAAGTPVVSTPVGDMPLLITQGKNGFICESHQLDKFIKKAYEQSDTLRKNCKETAKQYDWSVIIKRIEEIYD